MMEIYCQPNKTTTKFVKNVHVQRMTVIKQATSINESYTNKKDKHV